MSASVPTVQPEEKPADAWLTLADVARLLKVSERTVIRLTQAKHDRLLAARFGGCTRIRRAALEKWLAARERA